jgi:hypothetical protein
MKKGATDVTRRYLHVVPRRELKYPSQVERWLVAWGQKLQKPGKMILIGSEPRDTAHSQWAKSIGLC